MFFVWQTRRCCSTGRFEVSLPLAVVVLGREESGGGKERGCARCKNGPGSLEPQTWAPNSIRRVASPFKKKKKAFGVRFLRNPCAGVMSHREHMDTETVGFSLVRGLVGPMARLSHPATH